MWWHGIAGLEGRQAAPVTRLQSIQNIELDILKVKKKNLPEHNQGKILEFSHVHFTPEKVSWSHKTRNRHYLNSQPCNSVWTLLSPMRVRLKRVGWRAKIIRIIIKIYRVSSDLSYHMAPESHWLFRETLTAQSLWVDFNLLCRQKDWCYAKTFCASCRLKVYIMLTLAYMWFFFFFSPGQ